jgi:hypothetical protein
MITISWELYDALVGLLGPIFVVILIITLIIRLKIYIRRTIKNEIYDHFPTIKNKIEEFDRRMQYIKLLSDDLERRMRELERRMKK